MNFFQLQGFTLTMQQPDKCGIREIVNDIEAGVILVNIKHTGEIRRKGPAEGIFVIILKPSLTLP